MDRMKLEAMFKKMYENADFDVREALFQDLLGAVSTGTLKAIANNYKELGVELGA